MFNALPAPRTRVGVVNHFDQSAAVLDYAKTQGVVVSHVALTTGTNYPDGLAAGPFLAKDNGLLLLANDHPARLRAGEADRQQGDDHATGRARIDVGHLQRRVPGGGDSCAVAPRAEGAKGGPAGPPFGYPYPGAEPLSHIPEAGPSARLLRAARSAEGWQSLAYRGGLENR